MIKRIKTQTEKRQVKEGNRKKGCGCGASKRLKSSRRGN